MMHHSKTGVKMKTSSTQHQAVAEEGVMVVEEVVVDMEGQKVAEEDMADQRVEDPVTKR